MLGLKFSEKRKAELRRAEEEKVRQNQLRKKKWKKREEMEEENDGFGMDFFESFTHDTEFDDEE